MKKITIFLSFMLLYNPPSKACTNILVSKGATVDGSTMVTYSADAHFLYGELYHCPGMEYSDTAMRKIYEWDSGKYLGEIKQVGKTYAVVGNMNEYQVTIAESTFGGRPELQDTTSILDYGSLMYITLQRAKTAREAIKIMDQLVQFYGYYSTGESFSIADANEVWIMELIGKGVNYQPRGKGKQTKMINVNTGAVWVARKLPEGSVSAHANQARITTFPLNDPENCMYARDVISFARNMKYFEGKDEDFSFADAYAPLDFGAARWCEARVYSIFNRASKNMEKYLDYALGENPKNRMPLFVYPEEKLKVRDVMELMRDYYQNTPMDLTKDIGAGPYECIIRWRPLSWSVDSVEYFNERAISTQQTGFSFVAQMRNWLPNAIGGLIWFGVDDTYSTVYSPVYNSIKTIPENFAVGNGDMMTFSDSSAFWVFNQVSNLAYTRYNAMIPEIRKKQAELEFSFIKQVQKTDSIAFILYNESPEKAISFLNNYTIGACHTTFAQWKSMYHYLFVKYLDGNLKYKKEGQHMPVVEHPGYSEHWYRTIIEQTGEKFKYKGDNH